MALFLSFLWGPLALIVIAAVAVTLWRRHRQGRLGPVPGREAVTILVVVVLTLALLVFYVPRRVAFLLSRSSFEKMVQSAPESGYGGTKINARLGLYRVDEYAADPRGGVFFRVYSGRDGIGPDTMSYGFAHRPNRQGTPFGAAHYALSHVIGDWYWFRASDDWY